MTEARDFHLPVLNSHHQIESRVLIGFNIRRSALVVMFQFTMTRDLRGERRADGHRSKVVIYGRVGGHPPRLTPAQAQLAQQLYDAHTHTVQAIPDLLRVLRTTIYGHLNTTGAAPAESPVTSWDNPCAANQHRSASPAGPVSATPSRSLLLLPVAWWLNARGPQSGPPARRTDTGADGG